MKHRKMGCVVHTSTIDIRGKGLENMTRIAVGVYTSVMSMFDTPTRRSSDKMCD